MYVQTIKDIIRYEIISPSMVRTVQLINGFRKSNSDHTLFLKYQNGKITTLIIYVDDMIITENDDEEIIDLQKYLENEFKMKNFGGLKYFLGIEIARSK